MLKTTSLEGVGWCLTLLVARESIAITSESELGNRIRIRISLIHPQGEFFLLQTCKRPVEDSIGFRSKYSNNTIKIKIRDKR